jgi:hypothetical protein
VPEKKTADETAARVEDERVRIAAPFLSIGGMAQDRYERLRTYMLTEPAARPRVSPAQFDLRRFQRFGVLGLVEHDVLRPQGGHFVIELVALGTDDSEDRLTRLCALLGGWVTGAQGGEDATSGAVRSGVDGLAGEGADDPEPARRRHAGG